MPPFENALSVYNLLNKSNCRQCGLQTCMAFAGYVFLGKKRLCDCPFIADDILLAHGNSSKHEMESHKMLETVETILKEEITHLDLASLAPGLGGRFEGKRLVIEVLGKPFSIDSYGEIFTDIHIIPWVTIPVYKYLLQKGRKPLSKIWVSMRELKSGQDQNPLFIQRCEKPMRKLADSNPDLFTDMIQLFGARPIDRQYDSDISVVLQPLPRLPVLICYWHPEEGIESELHIFFDSSASDYLDVGSIHSLCTGFVSMLEKLTLRHG